MTPPRVVLFATDGSACAERARPVAVALAGGYGASLRVFRVEPLLRAGGHPDASPPTTASPAMASPAMASAEAVPGEPAVEVARWGMEAGHEILAYAAEVGAGLIVMGTHGRSGFDRLMLGSTAEFVLRRAACPVLLVPQGADPALVGRVLVADDLSDTAALALTLARRIAADTGMGLDVLHVVRPFNDFGLYGGGPVPIVDYEALLDGARILVRLRAAGDDDAPAGVEPGVHAVLGDPVEQILEHARRAPAGLIVMGSHGRKGLSRVLLGSAAEGVVRHAPCPVLVVRTDAHAVASAS